MPSEPYLVHGLEWQKQEEYEKYSIENPSTPGW